MTAHIKGCPQPDPPELVMRADGYHYRTEDEMKELTDEQIKDVFRLNPWHNGQYEVQLARAIIAADRDLNSADRKTELLQQAHDRAHAEVLRLSERLRKYEPGHSMHLNAAPADRDVMRQAPEGWKLAPIEPNLDQYNAACRAYVDWQAKCQEEARAHENEPSESWFYSQPHFTHTDVYIAMLAAAPTPPAEQPIDMVLHCPKCGMQHIDAPESEPTTYTDGRHETVWRNPAHRSHLCHGCGYIWRPADVPTNGVAAIKTKGKDDSPPVEQQEEQEPVGYRYRFRDPITGDPVWRYSSGPWNGQCCYETQPLYDHPSPSLSELRAKVEAMRPRGAAGNLLLVADVLAEIDKMGDRP